MNGNPPGFWPTVWLLLGAARKRAAGRQKRQQELLRSRAGKGALNWGGFAFFFGILFGLILNGIAAFALCRAVTAGECLEAGRRGNIVVQKWFLDALELPDRNESPKMAEFQREGTFSREARMLVMDKGGSEDATEAQLRAAARAHGTRDFVTEDTASPGLAALPAWRSFPAMLGSIMLIWWGVMLVFQGEGLELDLQRRRHPMWEWLFSHPAPPGAIFLAEMLSPIAANPIYCTAPLYVGILYGVVYGTGPGIVAALLIGIPITLAAACLGKALEIGITLRFSPRSRGAMIGLMSWLGYASMMPILLGIMDMPKIINAIGPSVEPFTSLPWPWLGLFLGERGGSFSFPGGMLACWIAAGITIPGALWFSVWGAQQGLSGNFGPASATASVPKSRGIRFGKEPLYRKEFLWFIRDRSAIVQTILIPLTVASYQIFNLRNALAEARNGWNSLCSVGILFGTYFLWVLGPKSLSSEGTALWISLTWPRGLESLLKAKAWLWSLISSGIVALVLCYAAIQFPDSIWKIGLVGVGWFFFGRSMAEKTVTLVSVTSSSGEPEKIPRSRRWAASLGMLTFAIGIWTQQWHIAIMGIVYSYMTAAAMWQNFRARLPYLYDPWSEVLPPPPTLMHAMIAISVLVEGGAVLTGLFLIPFGVEYIGVVQAVIYCICAVLVSLGLSAFLSHRDVPPKSIWVGPAPDPYIPSLMMGAAGGLLLGLLALGYLAALHHFSMTAQMIDKSRDLLAKAPGLRLAYIIAAVGFAPFAEEYLFRGLLFRALDREWGGWRAVIGSAAFFAIYHQPLSWLPVGLMGAANALLFKKTGRLAPAVLLHMVYNAIVLS